jgi:hypothetical protein
MREEFVQLLDGLVLAGVLFAIPDRPAIGGRLVLPRRQAAIAPACRLGGLGIDFIEIAQYRLDRSAEAVDVEAVKSGTALGRPVLVMDAQPIDKGEHLLVAPHPGREALKHRACFLRRREVTHIAVDARRIWPVGLDRNNIEAVRGDQMPRDRGAGTVKFGAAMRRLAKQHDARIAETVEQRAEFVLPLGRGQPLTMRAQYPRDLRGLGALPLQQFHIVRHGSPPPESRSL